MFEPVQEQFLRLKAHRTEFCVDAEVGPGGAMRLPAVVSQHFILCQVWPGFFRRFDWQSGIRAETMSFTGFFHGMAAPHPVRSWLCRLRGPSLRQAPGSGTTSQLSR